MLLCAQYILPITSDPIVNGAVLVRDGRIADIGSAEMMKLRYADDEVMDYGMSVILPGMIDLNTHLETAVMRGIVPDVPYTDWLQELRSTSAKLDAHDWGASSVLGALEALSSGVTCVADMSATGASCSAIQRVGLRGIVYREVGAMDQRRVSFAIEAAHNDIVRWGENVDASRISIGIAPRETHECHPSIYTEAARIAREENIPLAFSVAASQEESDFVRYGSSVFSMAKAGDRRGFVEVPPWLPTGVSPVRYVVNWGAFEAPNVMVVNCVHVGTDDIKKLKEYDVAIAGCPRFNAQLGMGIAPLEEFVRSGLRVGMGTGYAVSSGAADMLTVVRMGMLLQRAAGSRTFFGADEALRMATIDAARALHMDDKIGSLEIGKCADITAVDLSGSHQAPTDDPASALVNTCSGADVLMTMVGGDIRYEKDKWHLGVGVAKDIARVIEIRGKLRN